LFAHIIIESYEQILPFVKKKMVKTK